MLTISINFGAQTVPEILLALDSIRENVAAGHTSGFRWSITVKKEKDDAD